MAARIRYLLISALLSSCANMPRTYHMEAGARYDLYSEAPDQSIDIALSNMLGQPTFVLEGNPSKVETKGYGGHLGVQEHTKHFVTKLVLFYTTYDPIRYAFQVPTIGRVEEELRPKSYGLDVAIGYPIGWFRPQISYKFQGFTTDIVVTNPGGNRPESHSRASETQFMLGGGLALEIPFSKNFRLATSGDYRFPLSANGSIHEWTIQAGARFGTWAH